MQRKAAQFLLAEKSRRWSFNYWTRKAGEENGVPYPAYPDDLDDTFAALAALVRHDPAIIDGRAFAAIAKLLTARETDVGGPYRTWLVSDGTAAAWQDVDPVVNSTIGYFLSLIGVSLPLLENFINDAIYKDRFISPYYPGMLHAGYFISRYYKNTNRKDRQTTNSVPAQEKLANEVTMRLLNGAGGSTGITTLERAMAISTLINLGHGENIPPSTIDVLAAEIEREGFRAYAFCVDPSRDGKRTYAGSSALSAAFYAEALSLYEKTISANTIATSAAAPAAHDHIRALARASCREANTDLRKAALLQIERTTDERITTLAYEFCHILYRNGVIVPQDIVEQLALANLFGWMAYTIYDDTLDGDDDGGPLLLPCANLFLRSLTKIYAALDARLPGTWALFENVMNRIDNANTWEQSNCRFGEKTSLPSFGDHQILADRSIGHAMGPLAMLLFAGHDARSAEYTCVEQCFRHYLIARQIHDDAHDWEEDLLRGRVNSIGTLILQNFQKRQGENNADLTTVIAALPELQKLFWKEIIDDTVRTINFHITAARNARERSRLLNDSDFLESALHKLEAAAHRAISERDNAHLFLNEYKKSPAPDKCTMP